MASTSLSSKGPIASTGDLKNSVEKLLREIRKMKLQIEPDTQGWCLGLPSAFLPIYHSALMHYSLPLAKCLMTQGYSLYGKSDLKFVHGLFQVFRNVFNYQPRLTETQFLSNSYAERKLMLTCDFLLLCQEKHNDLTYSTKKRRSTSAGPSSGRSNSTTRYFESHPPEVHTIQEGRGFGSVWSEHIPVHACDPHRDVPSRHSEGYTLPTYSTSPPPQLAQHVAEYHYPPTSPPPSPNPPSPHTPTSPQHFSRAASYSSPSPHPSRPHHSRAASVPSPARQFTQPSPSPCQHSSRPDTQPSSPGRHSRADSHPSPSRHSRTDSHPRPSSPQILIDSPAHSIQDIHDCLHGRQGEEDDAVYVEAPLPPGSEEESWKSLPLAPAENQQSPNEKDTMISDLQYQVVQLKQLVETMSTRFVLVETQLKTAKESGGGGQATKRRLSPTSRDSEIFSARNSCGTNQPSMDMGSGGVMTGGLGDLLDAHTPTNRKLVRSQSATPTPVDKVGPSFMHPTQSSIARNVSISSSKGLSGRNSGFVGSGQAGGLGGTAFHRPDDQRLFRSYSATPNIQAEVIASAAQSVSLSARRSREMVSPTGFIHGNTTHRQARSRSASPTGGLKSSPSATVSGTLRSLNPREGARNRPSLEVGDGGGTYSQKLIRSLSATTATPTREETEGLIKNLHERAERTRRFLQHATGTSYTHMS